MNISIFDLRGRDFLDEIADFMSVDRSRLVRDETLLANDGRQRYERCKCGNRKVRGSGKCRKCSFAEQRARARLCQCGAQKNRDAFQCRPCFLKTKRGKGDQ